MFWKSCPLVTIWVPTRMRAAPLLMLCMAASMSPRPRTTSRSTRTSGAFGNSSRSRLLDAFGTLADRPHREAALWTVLRQRRVGAAVMAAQPARALVHGQARITVRAGGDPAAGRAQQRRRVAAAIEEGEHLAVRGQVPLHGLHHRRRQARGDRVGAQIDDREARRRGLAGAPRQRQSLVAAACHVLQRFEGGRGRARAPPAPARAARAPAPGRAPSNGIRPRAASARRRAPHRR